VIRRLLTLGIAVVGVVLLALHGFASACTCAQPASVEEGLSRADSVFLGLVERFELSEYGRVATLRVRRVWKGREAPRIEIITGRGDADCGFHFIAGIDYLVFAKEDPSGALHTTICTRTKTASGEAVEDLKSLGPGTPLDWR
jgi:hypothetical protein